MGLLGIPGLGADAPDAPKTIALDPMAKDAFDRSAANAGRSVGAIGAETNQGVSEYGSALGANTQQTNQMAAGTGQDPAYMQAIKNSYSAKSDADLGNIKNENVLQAQFRKSDQLKQVAAAAMGQQQAITQQYSFLTQVYNQQEAARAQMINQLFQTAEYGMGAYAGAHPHKPTPDSFSNELQNNIKKGGRVGGYAPDSSTYESGITGGTEYMNG